MVVEHCELGNLYDWLHSRDPPNSQSEITERINFAIDVAKGMEFLHTRTPPIIHRDLKSVNVLLKKTPQETITCKIADFGMSRGLTWTQILDGRASTIPFWTAPEIFRKQKYSEKVDVYSFGVIMWEIITGQNYFLETSYASQFEEKIMEGCRPSVSEKVPTFYSDVLKESWSNNPSDRPSFTQILLRLTKNNTEKLSASTSTRLEVDEYMDNFLAKFVEDTHENVSPQSPVS